MKKNFTLSSCFILLNLFQYHNLNAQSSDWLWAKSSGGTDYDIGRSIATDDSGNVYVTGSFESSSITFGSFTFTNDTTNGYADIFVVKYDDLGNVLWAKSAGAESDERSYSITTDDNGNVYVTGSFYSSSITFGSFTLNNNGNNDIFIVKYDDSGNVLWAKSAGGTSDDRGYSIVADDSSNVSITGYFSSSSITFGSTTLTNAGTDTSDIFIVKYDASGNMLWVKSSGGSSYDIGFGITTDESSNIYVTGSFKSSSISFDSITLNNSSEGQDIFIVKYDASGNVVWAKSAGGSSDDRSYSVATDGSGNVYITGYFWSGSIIFGSFTLTNNVYYDAFVVKYDTLGNVIWAKGVSGTSYNVGYSIATDGSGNVYVTGYFDGGNIIFGSSSLTNNGSSDIFIVKYDPLGNALWAKNAGGNNDDYGFGIASQIGDNLYVTGFFESSNIAFGSSTFTNNGLYDIFVAKLNTTTGIVNLSKNNMLAVYPNPSFGIFNIQFLNEPWMLNAQIKIYNVRGELVYDSPNATSIDLSIRPAGIYYLQLRTSEGVINKKLILQR